MRGNAQDMHPTGDDLHYDQDIQPAQRDRVEVEEIGREQSGRLCPQERAPAGVDVAWRRADPGGDEDPTDCAGANSMAETDQFPLHAAAPARILPGQAEDKVT
jgi:hypothetical protein